MTLSLTKRPVGVLVRLDYGAKGGSRMSVGRGDSVLGGTGRWTAVDQAGCWQS